MTAGALVGKFGKRARHWSERLLGDGVVHLVASDAHTVSVRSPRMSDAIPLLERLVGVEETARLLRGRPQAILDDVAPDHVPPPPGLAQPTPDATPARGGLARLRRLLSR